MDTIFTDLPMPIIRITEVELCRWLGAAAPGDTLEYHRGFLAVDVSPSSGRLVERHRNELAHLARRALWAANKGWVHLVQRRYGPNDHAYLLIARPRPQAKRPAAVASSVPGEVA
jgi:hypothetical protein